MTANEPLIQKHGGYRNLKSFQVAQLVFDVTVRFCERYINRRSRTHDQMVQAARSGVQNIAEGSQASGASKKTEIKLTNVARASMEELRLDYKDFLRQRGLPLWEREDPRRQELINRRCATADDVARWVKEMNDCGQSGQSGQRGRSGQGGRSGQKHSPTPSPKPAPFPGSALSPKLTPSTPSTFPEIAANAALVLIAVACSLLDRQIASLAKSFENEGGSTERLYRVRSDHRRNKA